MKRKPSKTEIYAQGFYEDSFKNAIPGTTMATQNGEFYLLTSTSKFGIAIPSKFKIHTLSRESEILHLLTYRLCHTYFNKAQVVREPAPLLYAQKHGKMIC